MKLTETNNLLLVAVVFLVATSCSISNSANASEGSSWLRLPRRFTRSIQTFINGKSTNSSDNNDKQQQQQQQQPKEPEKGNSAEEESHSHGDGDSSPHWGYSDQHTWAGAFPQCNGPRFRQSPIDIETDRVTFMSRFQLEFRDYNQEVEFEYKNTGHSVSLRPIIRPGGGWPSLRLSWIPNENEFELQEIHFHWGDGINKGSEHEINDQRAAAEMHMVHFRKGIDKESIGLIENSVAVVGVLIESDVIEHNKLEALVKSCEFVNGTDVEHVDSNPSNLIKLLPDSRHSFYAYNGSLTTPPCHEVVTWIIMSEPVHLSQDRLVELSNLEAQLPLGRQKINSNRREIQPLLDRPVYASFNTTESQSLKRTAAVAAATYGDGPTELAATQVAS